MKLLHLSDIPFTIAHDNLKRQQFIAPGDVHSHLQTANYVELSPEESYSPHTHPDCEEYFFIIEGIAAATVAGNTFMIKKGDFLVIAKGETHTFKNTSKNPCKYFQFRILL